jgi:hypothetical protein
MLKYAKKHIPKSNLIAVNHFDGEDYIIHIASNLYPGIYLVEQIKRH